MRHNYILVIGLLVTCMISQKVLSQTTYQIGAVEGSAAVSPTGAATYQIPVKVSEGTNDMQPSLSINYNSQAGNGLLGYGWELSGSSSITRTGNNFYFDGKSESVKLNSTDNLMLDGVRLILISGNHFESGAIYKKEVEDFSRIKLKGSNGVNGIEVQTRDGRILEYGTTTSSYIEASGTTTPLSWMLSKVTDRFGNYMTYSYYNNKPTGEFYLNRVDYTGNSTAGITPYSSVRFTYESRSDSVTRYVAGSPVRQKVRLKAIDCYYDALTIIRSYSFVYNTQGVYSRLTSVKESGASQAQYNPTTIDWNSNTSQNSMASQSISEYWNNGFTMNSYLYPESFQNTGFNHQFADFNGDGKTDIMFYRNSPLPRGYLFLKTGTGFSLKDTVSFVNGDICNFSPCDLNGDGLLDFVTSTRFGENYYKLQNYLFDGTNFTPSGNNYTASQSFVLTGDFNGDGKFEVLTQAGTGSSIQARLFNLSNGTTPIAYGGITNWGAKYNDCFPNNCYLSDFNGNGKTDVITMDATRCYVYELKEAGNGTSATFQQIATFNSTRLKNSNPAYLADFNGDGMSDAFVHDPGANTDYILYSTGTTFVEKSVGNQDVKDYVFIADCNRDGLPDIVHGQATTNGKWKLKFGLFNGSTFVSAVDTIDINPSLLRTGDYDGIKLGYLNFNASDFTGDGRTDFCITNYNSGGTIITFHDDTQLQVSGITNGIGSGSSFSYAPLTTTTNYNTFEYYSESGASCTFPVVKNIYPLLVVTNHSETLAGGEGVPSTSYTYKNLRRHVQGKGCLGFGEVSSSTSISQKVHHDRKSIYAYDVNKYFPYLKKETVCLNGVDSISTVENTYNLRNEGGLSFFPYQQKVREKDHLTGFESVTTISSCNIHGFPLSVTVQKGSALTQKTDYKYDSIISQTQRILGIPKEIKQTTERGGSSWIQKTTFYNTTLGIPQIKREYVNNSRLKSMEKLAYNSFGKTLKDSLFQYSSTTALVTSYQYSANGRDLIQKTDPVGLSESYTYDATRGLLATKTDYRGNVTSFEYDPMMRTKRVVYPDGTRDSVYYSWSTGAPNSVYCVTETHSNQPTTKTYYDLAGNEVRKSVQQFDGTYAHTDKNYDMLGRLYSVSYPYLTGSSPAFSTYTYDDYLRLTGISEPSGRNTTYSYSGGSVTETKNGLVVTRTTNAAGELISTSDAGGTTTNTLRPDGNPSVITSNGVATTFGYDDYGRKTSMTDPSAGMTRYTFNASGFMDSTINARNKVSKMVYDIYGNKTSVKMSDITVAYSYNSYKEPLKERSSLGFYHEVTYDSQGRLATETWYRYNAWTLLKSYTYSNGNLSTISYTTHDGLIATEQYIYAYGHLKQIKLNNDTIIWELKGVNGFSQPTQIATGPLTRNYSYTYGFPTNRNVKLGSTYLVNQDYTFNPATGNLTSRTMHGLTENFTYDNLNRLTGFGGKSVGYNPKGNITSKSDAGSFSYANDESPYSVTGITLSGGGIPPRDQNTSYKSFNALSSVIENSKKVTYEFGEGFDRIRRQDASGGAVVSLRYYFGPQYEIELVGNTTNINKEILYLCNGDGYSSPVAYVKTNGVWSPYYISRDYLGSITHLYNSSGSLVQELSYDAWGRLRNPLTNAVYSPDSEPAPFLNRGYTGHEHLTAFGLIHMNARAYDPAVGRFLSPDPYVVDPDFTQAYNRYSYCMNNPLVYTDPNGEFILPAVMIIAGIAGGSMNVISNWDNIQKNPWSSLTYFASGAVGGAVAVVNPVAGGAITATANVATDLAFGNMPHIQDARDVLKYAGLKALDGIGVAGTAQLSKIGVNAMTKWGWIENTSASGTFHVINPSLGLSGGMEGVEVTVSASKVPVGLSVVEGAGKSGANAIKEAAIHGNSLKSLRPTWGYKLYSTDGTFLKNGITSKLIPETRYTKTFMSDKYMVPFKQFPNRFDAYQWEFGQNQILRGPLNLNMH